MFWKKFTRFKLVFAVIAFLSIPLGFLYVQRRAPSYPNRIFEPVFDLSLMIQEGFASFSSVILGKLYALYAAFDSHDEMLVLRARLAEAKGLKVALEETHAENMRLKELLNFTTGFSGGTVLGSKVIGRTGAPLTRTIQIDKGRDQGVHRGDAVISSAGAVGQVLMTGRSYSDVLLLTDASSAIDVLVQRTRARGILKGVSSARTYRLRVNDFDRLHEIKEGDLIVTSGMGANFPSGVPVGVVSAIEQLPDSLYLEAEVEPFTRFDSIEEVAVLSAGNLQNPWQHNEIVIEKLGQSVASGTQPPESP